MIPTYAARLSFIFLLKFIEYNTFKFKAISTECKLRPTHIAFYACHMLLKIEMPFHAYIRIMAFFAF